ncbi:M14 family metallopeptidase, partial [bacterium]|nr:M14 family metallopeptidase [bacterium]
STLKVLSALRKENQAYHFSPPGSRARYRARQQLERCFCPPSAKWRRALVTRGVSLIEQAGMALAK